MPPAAIGFEIPEEMMVAGSGAPGSRTSFDEAKDILGAVNEAAAEAEEEKKPPEPPIAENITLAGKRKGMLGRKR